MRKEDYEEWLDMMLEEETFEEVLERFNITTCEVFELLLEEGWINKSDLKELMRYE